MRTRVLSIIFLTLMVIGTVGVIPALPLAGVPSQGNDIIPVDTSDEIPETMYPMIEQALAEDNPYLPSDFDIGNVLGDRENTYKMFYEPWKSKAAIHAMAYDEDTGFLALGGGYLYDNEVHLFRLNVETNQFDKVWDTGDGVFQSDILSLDFGDTDLNDFLEIVAASADGHVYVFEQRHIYDPYANTENQFDLVWKSPDMFKAFAVKVDDIDRDYRADIIAGGWDGKVHIYEYDNHSGYPFSEEHWITYDEVATLDIGERVYTIESGDTNNNGLPEVIVGTRDGTVYVYENDGITLNINGYPFPLINDNHYYLNWTSENYTWSPILSMDVGELDGTPGDEIALVAQGQGVFTLDWNPDKKTYEYQKVYRSYKEWETFGLWGLDFYTDRVVEAWNVTYHDPVNASINVPEQIEYVWGGSYFVPDASVYPYNTGMAGAPDGNYSTFDASDPSVDNATAIIDFGLDEEGTGSANADPDVLIKFNVLFLAGADVSGSFNFSISRDGTDFEQVAPDHFTYNGYYLEVDVDDALGRRQWDYFRYAKISVFNGATFAINSVELAQVFNTVVEALSVEIGQLKEDGNNWAAGNTEADKILVATSIGEFLGVKYNASTEAYDLFWESGDDDYYTFGAGVWDMVEVNTESDIPAWNLWTAINFAPQTGYIANQWSSGVIDPYTEQIFNMFLAQYPESGGAPKIVAYNTNGDEDSLTSALLAPMNNDFDDQEFQFEKVSVEPAYIWDSYLNPSTLPMLVVGGINEDIPVDSFSVLYRAQLLFYYRNSYTDDFVSMEPLWRMDVDGRLTSQVNLAKTTPKVSFADYDGDGDQDFVVSNGYLYMAENLKLGDDATGQLNFTLVPGYFDDINNLDTSAIWGQPDLVDIDGDGDLDLVLSYDSKFGSTVFINEGTADEPIWVEHKKIMSNSNEDTNLKLLNITDVRMVKDWGSYYDGLLLERHFELVGRERPEYYLYGFNQEYNSLWMAEPIFGSADSYVVASYPRVARINFNLMEGSNTKFMNLGYHIMEDWNNDADLDEWTLSITSGDSDSDGNNEIIIGDFDNNVYAFEHLVNNSYKRMFRSFDLNHTEVTDVSPYAYEDLEGISGDFNRRIWDHAKHLVADIDLDHDGLKEIVVAANLQVYIFEEVGLFGGDAMRFVYSFDLRDTEWGDDNQFIEQVTEITAMAAGNDIDYDGRGDLIVAAGPYLFIYNVNDGSFIGMEDNDYFVTTAVMEGRYYLIGNPIAADYKYARIHAIAVGDSDKDGYREVIIGGVEDVRLMRQNGFVKIYECRGGTFYESWSAPTEVTYWNPISVIKMDDQDYDGEREIIIGHSYGFDMWEHEAGVDNSYIKVEYVTASPNYPNVPLQTTFTSGDSFVVSNRSRKSITQLRHSSVDDIQLMIFENNNELWSKWYNTTSGAWEVMGNLPLPYPGGTTINVESEPHCSAWGDRVYITWNGRASNGSTYLFVTYYDYEAGIWGPGLAVPRDFFGYMHSPSVFQYNTTHIGVAYVFDFSFFGITSRTVNIKLLDNDLTGSYEYVNHALENEYDLVVHDAEVIRLDDGRFAMAMSATNPSMYKADHDIWVAVSNDDKLNFTGQYAHQATTSFYDEMYVDIDYMRTEDKSLVVLYERIGTEIEDRFGMIASQNDGATWNVEGYLNTIPDYVTRVETSGGSVQYKIGATVIEQPEILSPAFLAMDDGGFIYAGTFLRYAPLYMFLGNDQYGWIRVPYVDIVYGINPQSDWALNHLHDVVDLDVGDTDGDNRREVLVAFDDKYGVYELDSSNIGNEVMYYLEDYLSDPFENPVTAIAVSDSNGNGWDDIALACERGDVFFFEYTDTSEGFAGLFGSMQNLTLSTSGVGNFGNLDTMQAYDIDGDGKEEVIAGQSGRGEVIAFDESGTIIWNNTDAASGFNLILLADITNDTIPEVLLGSDDDHLWVLDITDGSLVWKYDTAAGNVDAIDVADVDNDGWVEIALGTSGDQIFLLDHTGGLLKNWIPALGDVLQLTLGNFTGGQNLTLAFMASSNLHVMDVMNGTVFYSTSGPIANAAKPIAFDYTEDGIDDIVFARDSVHILDITTSTLVYNSTDYLDIWAVWLDDFDGDSAPEIAGITAKGHVFLEDIRGGTTQWLYVPDPVFQTFDGSIGYFGGSGNLDIIIGLINGTSGGVLVAIDGKSGIPLWFNRTGGIPWTVSSADLHGTGIDSGLQWELFSSTIVAVDSYERVVPAPEEKFPVHGLYWNQTLTNATITGTTVVDINSDGLDEVVAWYNVTVALVNGTNGAILWTRDFSKTISQVRVGDMDGIGWLDIIAVDADSTIHILRGTDGSEMGSITSPTDTTANDLYVRDFDPSQADDEIAVLWANSSHAYVVWYGHDGTEHYRSSTAVTFSYGTVGYMAVGDITGDGNPDVLIGGSNNAVEIYRGTDGQLHTTYNTGGSSVYGIVVGDLTGDVYEDFAWLDSSYVIYIVNGQTSIQTGFIDFTVFPRDVYTEDLTGDGVDEIITSFERTAIYGFDYSGSTVWYWEAPVLLNSFDFSLTFADMNGDSVTDLVFTNHEYLAAVDITNNVLLWHYAAPHQVVQPIVGVFTGNTNAPDVVSYWQGNVYTVSGVNPTPTPPAPAVPLMAASLNLGDMVAVAAGVGIPVLFIALVPVSLIWYRKRKDTE